MCNHPGESEERVLKGTDVGFCRAEGHLSGASSECTQAYVMVVQEVRGVVELYLLSSEA